MTTEQVTSPAMQSADILHNGLRLLSDAVSELALAGFEFNGFVLAMASKPSRSTPDIHIEVDDFLRLFAGKEVGRFESAVSIEYKADFPLSSGEKVRITATDYRSRPQEGSQKKVVLPEAPAGIVEAPAAAEPEELDI